MSPNFLETYFPRSDLNTHFLPPANKFDFARDVPDQRGKVFLVTSGSEGIGLAAVRELFLKGAKVYLAAADERKARAAISQLEQETTAKGELVFLKLDLANLASVRKSAEEFLKLESSLDVLINNGQVMLSPPAELTSDGYDLQFGANVLGRFLLTKLLTPALLAAADARGVPSRVVNLTSTAHQLTFPGSGFNELTMIGGAERDAELKRWSMVQVKLYGQNRFGSLAIVHHFSRAYPGKVVACNVHPGRVKSEFQSHVFGYGVIKTALDWLGSWVIVEPQMGAINSVYAATVAAPEEINGQYVIPWARIGVVSEQAENAATMEEIRAWMDKQLLNH